MGLELNDVQVSKDKITEGVWLDLGGGARVKLASIRCPEFQTHWSRLTAPYEKMGREMTTQEKEDAMIICLSAHCVLEWEEITMDNKPLEPTAENVEMVMRRFEWMQDKVIAFCTEVANYFETADEGTEKNSKSASGGTSSGETSSKLSKK